NLWPILLVSVAIIVGKLISVTFGAFATGQTIRTSVQTGFSMAQIGEFSYIIGGLGLAFGVLSVELYPVVVAASLVTTFTTPYLIKASAGVVDLIEARLPVRAKSTVDSYAVWLQRRTVSGE